MVLAGELSAHETQVLKWTLAPGDAVTPLPSEVASDCCACGCGQT